MTPREPTVVRVGRSTVSSEQRSYMPTTTLNFRKRREELTLLPRTDIDRLVKVFEYL